MMKMNQVKITVLNDNTAGNGCSAEHGLSFLVEADMTFLFDTGPSDIFIRNANILKLDLEEINTIVLSHRHYDHSNGLKYLKGKRLICHPCVFNGNFRGKDNSFIGMPFSKLEAEKRFKVIYSKQPFHISDNVIFLGEIPRKNDFEAKTTLFIDEKGDEDFIMDDSAVAIKTEKGLVIISGCAHSGICNIVDHAVNISGEKKVYAVVGGFHLKENNEETQKTVEHLKHLKVEKVIPSHCTELPALKAFYEVWPFKQIKSGQVIQL